MTYWKGASYFAEDVPNPTSGVQTNKNEMYAPPTSVNIPEETAGECQTEWFVTDFWLRECDDDVEDADTAIRCLLRIRITATADGSGGWDFFITVDGRTNDYDGGQLTGTDGNGCREDGTHTTGLAHTTQLQGTASWNTTDGDYSDVTVNFAEPANMGAGQANEYGIAFKSITLTPNVGV